MKRRSGFIVSLVIGLVLAFLLRQSLFLPAKEEKVMDGFEALLAQEDLTVAQVIAYVDQHIKDVSREGGETRLRFGASAKGETFCLAKAI